MLQLFSNCHFNLKNAIKLTRRNAYSWPVTFESNRVLFFSSNLIRLLQQTNIGYSQGSRNSGGMGGYIPQ